MHEPSKSIRKRGEYRVPRGRQDTQVCQHVHLKYHHSPLIHFKGHMLHFAQLLESRYLGYFAMSSCQFISALSQEPLPQIPHFLHLRDVSMERPHSQSLLHFPMALRWR